MIQSDERSERASGQWRDLAPFVIYLVAFYAVWTGWVVVLYPHMQALGDGTLAYALINVSLRSLVWVLPVFLYIRYVDDVDPVEYLRLRSNWRRGIAVGLLISGINLLGSVIRLGAPHPSPDAITWNSIISTSCLIGFIEEIPFRGFMLRKLEERLGAGGAIVATSLLFVGIHLPGWTSFGIFRLSTAVAVFVLGAVFALAVHYTKSLWSAVIAHSLNDFFAAIVFRG